MSHVRLNSTIKLTLKEEKSTEAKIERFSDAVTTILQAEAASKLKKLVYVFIRVDQKGPVSFSYEIDDSRDKISEASKNMINTKFESIFGPPAVG